MGGLSKNPDKLYRYRCVELKHGRIAMLAGWVQIIFFIGVFETQIFKQDKSKAPGDTAPAGWKRYSDPAERDAKLTSELKNGRLAMMAIMGQMVQQKVWGVPIIA